MPLLFSHRATYLASHDGHRLWLRVAAVIVMAFGPVFFLGTMETTSGLARWSLDLLSWPVDGSVTYADPDTRFLSALTGGFLMGWGVLIWALSGAVHDAAPEPLRKAVLAGFSAWFVVDSAGSVASGNAINTGFNLLILLIAIGPLWRPAQGPVGRRVS